MKAILLHNWRAKIASLLLAFAIWFLIRLTIQDQLMPKDFPVPGTTPPPSTEPPPPPPIPGVSPVSGIFPPACEEIVAMAQISFHRLHWVEAGEFAASLVEFPARAIV